MPTTRHCAKARQVVETLSALNLTATLSMFACKPGVEALENSHFYPLILMILQELVAAGLSFGDGVKHARESCSNTQASRPGGLLAYLSQKSPQNSAVQAVFSLGEVGSKAFVIMAVIDTILGNQKFNPWAFTLGFSISALKATYTALEVCFGTQTPTADPPPDEENQVEHVRMEKVACSKKSAAMLRAALAWVGATGVFLASFNELGEEDSAIQVGYVMSAAAITVDLLGSLIGWCASKLNSKGQASSQMDAYEVLEDGSQGGPLERTDTPPSCWQRFRAWLGSDASPQQTGEEGESRLLLRH